MNNVTNALPIPEMCDNCMSSNVVLAENSAIYGRNFGEWPYCYICLQCKAMTGCHPNTYIPLGRMADKETRQMRVKAHGAFDPLWKSKLLSRHNAYAFLARALAIELDSCHISWLTKDQLLATIEICEEYYKERGKSIERRKAKRRDKNIQTSKRTKKFIRIRKYGRDNNPSKP